MLFGISLYLGENYFFYDEWLLCHDSLNSLTSGHVTAELVPRLGAPPAGLSSDGSLRL